MVGHYSKFAGEFLILYWRKGFQYHIISDLLHRYHGISISVRAIKYYINVKLGLRKRGQPSSSTLVRQAIARELDGAGSLIGYRLMTKRLQSYYGLQVPQRTVMNILKEMDPVGVEQRRRRRLSRRIYRCIGPNYVWHIDGNDKLSQFGLSISGCIDGFSRKIIFLRVAYTNHDPKVISSYYLDGVEEVGGCPRHIRTDCGTENVILAALQSMFVGEDSHRYVGSPANQRIEAWWSFLRKHSLEWWISFFKDLLQTGEFHNGNTIHLYCLRFCFMDVLQKELDSVREMWNCHRIRPSKMAECPAGIPDELYFLPERHGTQDLKCHVQQDALTWARQHQSSSSISKTGDVVFDNYASYVMRSSHHNFVLPTTWQEALQLYRYMISVAG